MSIYYRGKVLILSIFTSIYHVITFDQTTPYPVRKYAEEIDIFICMEQVSIPPDMIAISNNLAVYKSHTRRKA